ncbi:hypothetical protein GDO78_014727 [Eleutherodactylus coqui]|uniref:Uncharacterized protein n=1 Tax=Eleutherodactylus coqui TaxID=57060 RepID=A0A8J6EPQ2_ELECQ|nr:hypothetical protein GDO78_014727 [Eleutherodactylus coqui]
MFRAMEPSRKRFPSTAHFLYNSLFRWCTRKMRVQRKVSSSPPKHLHTTMYNASPQISLNWVFSCPRVEGAVSRYHGTGWRLLQCRYTAHSWECRTIQTWGWYMKALGFSL